MTEPDLELERRVRAGLAARAGEVDTTVPVATRARAAARRHRRRRVAAAAVAAALVVVGTVAVVDRASAPDGAAEPSGPTAPLPTLPSQWRTEYWHDVSVEVPADWAWGAGPFRSGGEALRCGGPDPGTPYVGRPVLQSDACQSLTVPAPGPRAPYVWFDAPVELGTVELDDGYVQDTVEVDADGTTVTVGSDAPALRERILSSITVQQDCPTLADDDIDLGGLVANAVGVPESFRLCAYTDDVDGGDLHLVYGRDLGSRSFADFTAALEGAPSRSGRCPLLRQEVVLLTATWVQGGSSTISRSWAANLRCGTFVSTDRIQVLDKEIVDSWADDGLRLSMPTFIGPQG